MIYLASPYTHPRPTMQEQRYLLVCKYAARLAREGKYVFSPIAHWHPISVREGLPGTWEYWSDYNRELLSRCDALYVLRIDGWKESTGVKGEMVFAVDNGIPIIMLDPS